jgi:uncharacterized protein DUF5615
MWKKILPVTEDEVRAADHFLRKKARFLVDENIGKLASILRELGWDAVSAHEAGLRGHSDEDLFAFGWKRKRVIITNDDGFLDDRRYPFHRCPGVLIVPSPAKNFEGFADALASGLPVVGRYSGAFDREKIAIRSDGTWTVRGFSKEPGVHWKAQFKVDEHGQAWEWV